MNIKRYGNLFLQAGHFWSEDKVTRLSAALAYYTIFSLAPLLLILVAIAGFIYGKDGSQSTIMQQFNSLFGAESAKQIQAMMQSADKPATGIISTIIGAIVLLVAASGLFTELQDGLNSIWNTQAKYSGIKGFIKQRLLSFSLVIGIAFLLLISLILSGILTAISSHIASYYSFAVIMAEGFNFVFSLVMITILFALIYKVLPDLKIRWEEVWFGALITALLFTIGKTLLGLYLGLTHIGSSYGAASSLIIVLVWVYYSAQILYFGAELTKAHAISKGRQWS